MQRQKSVISFLVLVLGFILLYSCEKVTLREPPPGPIVDSVKFSVSIKPIFNACIACHKSGLETPNLKDNPYQALKDGNYFDVVNPSQSILYVQLKTKTSHAGKATPDQMLLILQWITQGALNN